MKPLNINFGATQELKITDLAGVTGANKSDVGRAAMQLGLNQIQALAARDLEKGLDLVLINSTRGKM